MLTHACVILRQLEHAWLDLGSLDSESKLYEIGNDLSNASKMVFVAQTLMCSLGSAYFAYCPP